MSQSLSTPSQVSISGVVPVGHGPCADEAGALEPAVTTLLVIIPIPEAPGPAAAAGLFALLLTLVAAGLPLVPDAVACIVEIAPGLLDAALWPAAALDGLSARDSVGADPGASVPPLPRHRPSTKVFPGGQRFVQADAP